MIALLFDNFGPYHLGRLDGAKKVLGSETVGLQVVNKSREYDWTPSYSGHEIVTSLPINRNATRAFQRAVALWRTLNRLQPRLVAIAGYGSLEMLSALIWALFHQRIAILMSESKADDEARSVIKEVFKGWIVKRFDAAVVGGKPHRRYLEKLGFDPRGIFLGYDVVDNFSYHPSQASSLLRPIARPYFLLANRFVTKKNLAFVLDCYRQYCNQLANGRHVPWELVLAGDGELRDELQAHVQDLGLQSVVHFPGFLQQSELLRWLTFADAFIHASTTEQWGLVVNEAMAAGKPVFVSRRCGCFEDLIIEGKTGLGFDPTNEEELVDLMAQATSGELPLRELGSAALAHIDDFSPLTFGLALKKAMEFASQRRSVQVKNS